MTDRAAPLALALALSLPLALGACTRAMSPEPTPAASEYVEEPAPELLGEPPATGPRPKDETGLLGGPPAPGAEGGAPASATMTFRRPDGVVVSTMKTIPDEAPAAEPVSGKTPRKARPAKTRRKAPGVSAGAVTAAAAPVTAAAPLAAQAAPAPEGELGKAPANPFVRALPLAPPDDPKLAALQGAVSDETAAGARLSVADQVPQGQPGEARLSLPAALAARLKAEAAKLGLGTAARTAEVTARLSGEGYTFDPPGPQTLALKPDEEIVFNWKVTPAQGSTPGPLKAEADVALTGDGAAKSFAVAALEQTTPPPAAAPAAKKAGPTTAKWALAAILILMAAMVLGGVWRNHRERQRAEAERRARERAARNFSPMAPPKPAPEGEAAKSE